MDIILDMVGLIILFALSIYNAKEMYPRTIYPRGYWREHPRTLAIYFFAVIIIILSFFIGGL